MLSSARARSEPEADEETKSDSSDDDDADKGGVTHTLGELMARQLAKAGGAHGPLEQRTQAQRLQDVSAWPRPRELIISRLEPLGRARRAARRRRRRRNPAISALLRGTHHLPLRHRTAQLASDFQL